MWRDRFNRRVAGLMLLTGAALLARQEAVCAQPGKPVAARCAAVEGALVVRTKEGTWESVATNSVVPVDRLVVALFGADFRSRNDAVEARMIADVGQRGPFPVLEAAVRFHASQAADLEATLERGVLVLANMKKSGSAKVRLRVRGEVFDLTLHDATTRVGIEVYGRHVPGPAKLGDPEQDDPVLNVVFFLLQGEAVVSTERHATRLQAPPGNAMYLWDNLTKSPEVRRFEKVPDSVKPFDDKERKLFDQICHCAKHLADKPGEIGKALEKATHSPDAGERKVAVVALGALDELPRLLNVLEQKDHSDARDMAVLVLRHWLGREPGQSIKLYRHLTKDRGYTPVQAKVLLYLCNGIETEKMRQPGTYDVLIGALNHSKAPVRELARWHLVRLVPGGAAIAYDSAAAEPQRLQSIAAWRRLVPEGELPLPSKKTPSNP
jgi:hypothetical protein